MRGGVHPITQPDTLRRAVICPAISFWVKCRHTTMCRLAQTLGVTHNSRAAAKVFHDTTLSIGPIQMNASLTDRDPTPASFPQRVVAQLIDLVAVLAILGGIALALDAYNKAAGNPPRTLPFGSGTPSEVEELRFVAGTAGTVHLLFFSLFEASRLRGTPGKRLLRLQVLSGTGSALSLSRAFGRNLAKAASVATFGIGFLTPLFTARRQTLHDMIANCIVGSRAATSDA